MELCCQAHTFHYTESLCRHANSRSSKKLICWNIISSTNQFNHRLVRPMGVRTGISIASFLGHILRSNILLGWTGNSVRKSTVEWVTFGWLTLAMIYLAIPLEIGRGATRYWSGIFQRQTHKHFNRSPYYRIFRFDKIFSSYPHRRLFI